jgi:hypothetical protein
VLPSDARPKQPPRSRDDCAWERRSGRPGQRPLLGWSEPGARRHAHGRAVAEAAVRFLNVTAGPKRKHFAVASVRIAGSPVSERLAKIAVAKDGVCHGGSANAIVRETGSRTK